jgi:hypothetical protein
MSDQVSKQMLNNPSPTVEEVRQALHRILEIIAAKIAQEIVANQAQPARQTRSVSSPQVTERSDP